MTRHHLGPTAELLAESCLPRNRQLEPRLARRVLVSSMRQDRDFNLVALFRAKVVGYICALRPRGQICGWGPLAVHPDHLGDSLADELMMRTIGLALEHEVGLLRLLMPSGLSRLSFALGAMKLAVSGRTYLRFERRPVDLVPMPSEHTAQLLDVEDMSRLAHFDRELFTSAERETDFRSAIDTLGGRAWLLEKGNEARGFVFNVPGLGIGPLAALDSTAGVDALRVATSSDHRRGSTSVIHIDASDRILVQEALRLGYACREPLFLLQRSFGASHVIEPRGHYCLGVLGTP